MGQLCFRGGGEHRHMRDTNKCVNPQVRKERGGGSGGSGGGEGHFKKRGTTSKRQLELARGVEEWLGGGFGLVLKAQVGRGHVGRFRCPV